MNANFHKTVFVGGAIVALVLLPSCFLTDMFKGKSIEQVPSSAIESQESGQAEPLTGEVIATMDGKPLITSAVLDAEKENIFKSNPQIKAAIAFMDQDVLNKNLTEGLVSQAVVDRFVVQEGLHNSAEYQSELAAAIKAIKRALNAKFFSQKFQVAITDSEARKFYDENRDSIPGLLVSQGGTVASGIQFDSQATAKDFIGKVKLANNNFARAAQQEGVAEMVKDFKVVNSQSVGIDVPLRDKIVAIKTVPSVELIVVDGVVWVVNATAKETAKYIPFDQVKDNIKQELEKNKRGELFDVEIKKLRDKYAIVINEDYFASSTKDSSAEADDNKEASVVDKKSSKNSSAGKNDKKNDQAKKLA